jgi:5-methylcytosine-specific restriction endonuclease McrA
MGFLSRNKKPPYYVVRPDENIIRYVVRVIKSIIQMYPHAKKHGIRYYIDTNFRRKLSNHRRQKSRRDREGPFSRKAVKAKIKTDLIERDGEACNFCKESFLKNDLTIDHVFPLFMGGGSELENLQLLCVPCHVQKTKDDTLLYVKP